MYITGLLGKFSLAEELSCFVSPIPDLLQSSVSNIIETLPGKELLRPSAPSS